STVAPSLKVIVPNAAEGVTCPVSVTGSFISGVSVEDEIVVDVETITVSNAELVVAVPFALEKTARYFLPLSAATVVMFSVVEVASGILLNVPPLSVLTCHCTVGVGLPFADAVKVATDPALTV